MADKSIAGKISFIHHEKNRAVIEYIENGKKKNIQADIDDKAQSKLVEQKIIKKPHRFLVGDQVKFQIKKTGGNGRILYADAVIYQYNTALEILINKAVTENKFLGYIKITDQQYFIKEIDSYLFFPLKISAYEVSPTEKQMEHPVSFKLENIANPDKIFASLYNHSYIPEFLVAIRHFKNHTPLDAVINKITPFGIYLNLLNDKLQAKIPIDKSFAEQTESGHLKIGALLKVKITHLSPEKIIVEPIIL